MSDLASINSEGRALLEAGALSQVEALVRPHLAGGRGPVSLWEILAKSLRRQGRAEEALPIQRMLVETVPSNFGYRFDLAETCLLLGDFERGWREYHHRYSMPHTIARQRPIQRPRWNGRPIPGKTLLIHDEQGFGDTFQFIRMVEWAKERSQATVVLDVFPEIYPLARRLVGHDHLIRKGQLPPAFDVHCEMMSLPMVMGFRMEELPGRIPYLTPDPERLAHWQQRLSHLARPLIALSWAGRPIIYNNQNRAASLKDFTPLSQFGFNFVAIQKGAQAEEANTPPEGMSILNLAEEIQDFEDTAAILSTVDLLVANDSAPAHLAGALGRPAWVMLPFVPDWRWQLKRADSPWYPSLRLFRQPKQGEWGLVVAEIAAELAKLKNAG